MQIIAPDTTRSVTLLLCISQHHGPKSSPPQYTCQKDALLRSQAASFQGTLILCPLKGFVLRLRQSVFVASQSVRKKMHCPWKNSVRHALQCIVTSCRYKAPHSLHYTLQLSLTASSHTQSLDLSQFELVAICLILQCLIVVKVTENASKIDQHGRGVLLEVRLVGQQMTHSMYKQY